MLSAQVHELRAWVLLLAAVGALCAGCGRARGYSLTGFNPPVGINTGNTTAFVEGSEFLNQTYQVGFFSIDGVNLFNATAVPSSGPDVTPDVYSGYQMRLLTPHSPIFDAKLRYLTLIVRLCEDGFTWSYGFVLFTYYMPLDLYSISPAQASLVGGSHMSIFGDMFMNTGEFLSMSFKVGSNDPTVVEAEFIGSNELRCTVPNVALLTKAEHELVAVSVSIDGQVYFEIEMRALFSRFPAMKVGFIFLGERTEVWTAEQYFGYLYVKSLFGTAIDVVFTENVGESDAEAEIERMVMMGCSLIFSCSLVHANGTYKAAPKYPHTKFVLIAGVDTYDNLATTFPRFYQPFYGMGQIAALKSESGRIGFLAAMYLPEGFRALNAFTLGVRSVNSSYNVSVLWSNSFDDEVLEGQAAEYFASTGFDVMAQNTDSSGAAFVFQAAKLPVFGYLKDMRAEVGEYVMTSVHVLWGPLFEHFIRRNLNGQWGKQWFWEGFEAGCLDYYDYSSFLTSTERGILDSCKNNYVTGAWRNNQEFPFVSGIRDVDGNVVPDEELTGYKLYDMTWAVEGVEDLGYWTKRICNSSQEAVQFDVVSGKQKCVWCEYGVVGGFGGTSCKEHPEERHKTPTWLLVTCIIVVTPGALFLLFVFLFLVFHWRNKFVRRSQPLFLLIVVLGGTLAFIDIYLDFTVVSDAWCSAGFVLLGLAFVLAFGSLFAKTWRIYRIYHNPKLKARRIPKRYLLTFVLVLLLVESTLLIVWLTVDRPKLVMVDDPKYSYVKIPTCESKSIAFFVFFFVYKLILLLWGSYISFRVRNVHSDYNETKWIGFSIYTIVLMMCAAPIYVLIRAYPDPALLLSVLAKNTAATGVIFAIFAPKMVRVVHHNITHWTWKRRRRGKSTGGSGAGAAGEPLAPYQEKKHRSLAHKALMELRDQDHLLSDTDADVRLYSTRLTEEEEYSSGEHGDRVPVYATGTIHSDSDVGMELRPVRSLEDPPDAGDSDGDAGAEEERSDEQPGELEAGEDLPMPRWSRSVQAAGGRVHERTSSGLGVMEEVPVEGAWGYDEAPLLLGSPPPYEPPLGERDIPI